MEKKLVHKARKLFQFDLDLKRSLYQWLGWDFHPLEVADWTKLLQA